MSGIDTTWMEPFEAPMLIAGPCSAETEEQLLDITQQLYNQGIGIIRAGIWKPRTRPNSFEGIGTEALRWISLVKQQYDVKFAIEVANPQHVELALKYDIDILWIGARSTVNPFTVQEIAEALAGTDKPILVKNPINPDVALWIGAIERLMNQGINKVGAIHRGFSSFRPTRYRNEPLWQIPIELKRTFPDIPMICDPSHIGGDRTMIRPIAQKALDLNYDGIMIEVHNDPDNAWSDAKQQVTPDAFSTIRESLTVRTSKIQDAILRTKLGELREKINGIDHDLLETLATRKKVIEEIGLHKKENNITIFQLERWKEIMETRPGWAADLGLSSAMVEEIFKLIHAESIKVQTTMLNEDLQDEQ
jgi:chorismate mutase